MRQHNQYQKRELLVQRVQAAKAEAERADSEVDVASSPKAYKQAIDLRPNYVRTLVNIGLANDNQA